jgi:CRP-like cAMP-binding protein
MKTIHDPKQLKHWIDFHHLDQIFPPDLIPSFRLISLGVGEGLYQPGERLKKVYILVKGKMKIYFLQENGSVYLIGFNQDFAIMGDLELFEDYPLHNEVSAMEPTLLIEIDRDKLMAACWDYPPFLRFMIKHISRKFHSSSVKSNALSRYSLESRLAAYLLTIDSREDHTVSFVKADRYTDLANLLGCSYRHLHRILQHFVDQGLIEKKGRQLRILDHPAIKDLAKDITYI